MPTITANTNNELMASSDKAAFYFISLLSYPVFSYLPRSNNRDGQNIEKACHPNKRKHTLF